jgi:hypothetical protein
MATESEEPLASDLSEPNELAIVGHLETRRKFIKHVAGARAALAAPIEVYIAKEGFGVTSQEVSRSSWFRFA